MPAEQTRWQMMSSVAAAPPKGKARRAAVQEQPQAEGAVTPGSGFGKGRAACFDRRRRPSQRKSPARSAPPPAPVAPRARRAAPRGEEARPQSTAASTPLASEDAMKCHYADYLRVQYTHGQQHNTVAQPLLYCTPAAPVR